MRKKKKICEALASVVPRLCSPSIFGVEMGFLQSPATYLLLRWHARWLAILFILIGGVAYVRNM